MARPVLLFTASAALLLLLTVILLWMGLNPSLEEIVKHSHRGYIVEA